MEAIDKIYILSNLTPRYAFKSFNESEVEYTRKEALLEWLEGCKNNPVITDLQKGNIQELIKKLNEM